MAKILLIEDDPLMVRMYQRKLMNDGYDVGVAVNGEEGLVQIRSFRPDLVLLDIMMPKLNGLEVLERMKADPTIARIPVIILTNLGGSEEDIDRGLELGAVAYLVKSAYRPDEVVKKVKEVLAGYTRSKEIPEAAPREAAERVAYTTEKENVREGSGKKTAESAALSTTHKDKTDAKKDKSAKNKKAESGRIKENGDKEENKPDESRKEGWEFI